METTEENIFNIFTKHLTGELYTLLESFPDEEKPGAGKDILENEKRYAWTFVDNFIVEHRDEYLPDLTTLHAFAIGFLRIMCGVEHE